jgi:signal transduction histidine kinase
VADGEAVAQREGLDGLLAVRGRYENGGVDRRAIGLKEVDELVARSGLRVTRETVGTAGRLSTAQEVTAYRVIQESLTNTLRHAGADAVVTLRLVFTSQAIRVEVMDDGGGTGRAAKPAIVRPGHGLVGMHERVAVHGGELVIGPRPEGGWQVVATIPRASGGVS